MVGGVCINAGTIPSKTMREAVLRLSGFYDQAFYGSHYHLKDNITRKDLNFRVTRVIENKAGVLQDQCAAAKRENYLFHPHRFQLSHARGMLQTGSLQRSESPGLRLRNS